MLTYHLHSTCRLLGTENRLTPQIGVCGRKALFSLCRSFGQVPGCQESVMLSLASSLALFHSSHIQDKAQINIGILYKNLVQLIKARTGGSINTTGLTSILYYLITHLRNICFNTVPHCKIPSHALKKNFPCPQTQFLFLFLCAEMARKSRTLDQLKLEA